MRVIDLAEVMVEMLAPVFGHDPRRIRIDEVGTQPGEKLYEELASHEEIQRTTDDEGLLVITPPFIAATPKEPVRMVRNSAEEPPMSKDQIAKFLTAPDVLPDDLRRQIDAAPEARDESSRRRAT